MTDSSNDSSPTRGQTPTRRALPRMWPWFVTGFLIVFVAMLFAVTKYSMLPSGRAVVASPLWRYYVIEGRRALGTSGALGPASGSSSMAIGTALGHMFWSMVAGTASVAVGAVVHSLRVRPRS
jgi:hypothetical protein